MKNTKMNRNKIFVGLVVLSLLLALDSALAESGTMFAELTPFQKMVLEKKTPLPVAGLRKAFATAYQGCESLKLAPMTTDTPDSEGVEEIGNYPGSWTAKICKISDPSALARTHYYIKNQKLRAGCLDVKKYEMIYDYGGKPMHSDAKDSSLNFWRNNGGGRGLGIDCSGFVFSSLAGAGLRLVANQRLQASDVEDIPAASYVHPENNGLTCLKNITVGKAGSLQAGDILASKYHVAMVERVGADPLAIHKYQDCDQITYRDFDFVIAQSSPEQNYVGINKYEAKEYLAGFWKFIFRGGLEDYARDACRALQANKNTKPGSDSFGVSRHKLTPECIQPEIKLDGESCALNCKELFD